MQVKSIAECSKESILQYFRPSLSFHLSLRSLFCLFLSGRFTQVLLYVLHIKIQFAGLFFSLYPPQTLFVVGILFSLYPPQTLFVVGILFSRCPCVRACVRPSVMLCFLNILNSHGWIFIKPCKHVHICKTNTLNKKVRARDQFY